MTTPIGFVDIREQHEELRDDLAAAVREVFEAGAFVLGRFVAAFEEEFGRKVGIPHVVGVNSGTDALVLALDLVRTRSGPGEVVTTPFTFFATAEAVLQAGHTLRFADIEPTTFNLDPAAARAALTPRTVAVMPVHLYGQCADVDALPREGVALIEDAAQAVGATYKGRPAGGLGDGAGFSFYVTKNLGAAGDAGAFTTRDAGAASLVRSLRAHGEVKEEGGRTYHYERVGRNSRLDALQAAVLRVKLKRLAAWQAARARHAAFYDEALGGVDGIVPPPRTRHGDHVYHQYVVRAVRRDALREHLARAGIQTSVFYPRPLHLQPALAGLGFKEGQFPEAERACREVLALPVHAHLRAVDLERVVAEVRAFCGA
ncbi:MAG: DegT/DnrJ/EryC1/StrS family aminotransferase [Planctomycetota bacterium]|jgi:dTDP-4-amino-4,6-dideoxygalactose transaminase